MDDMRRMQEEAAQRVSRMQEHSRRVVEAYRDRAAVQECPPARLYDRPPSDTSLTTSSRAPLEGEQILLLGLAFLLFRSGCRMELILALLYIAL